MISLTIVAALKVAGIILAILLLIVPSAIAYVMIKRFSLVRGTEVIIAMLGSFSGDYLSTFTGSVTALTILLMMTILFNVVSVTTLVKLCQFLPCA